MFIGYDHHTKGYRVRIGDKVVVSRNVHFVEGKNGAITICRNSRENQSLPSDEVITSAPADHPTDEDECGDVDIPTTSNPFEVLSNPDDNAGDEATTSSQQPRTTVPEQATSTTTSQRLPQVINKTWATARDVENAPTPSSGTRARSRQVLRMLMGYPVKVPTSKTGGKANKRAADRPPPLSREERLQQRNARKEALQVVQEDEMVLESASEVTDVMEVEVGGGVMPTQESSEECGCSESETVCELPAPHPTGEGDLGDECEPDSASVSVAYVVEQTAVSRAACESKREQLLRGTGSSEHDVHTRQGKAQFFDQVKGNSAEEVVGVECNADEDIVPSASLAFLQACLASPVGVKFCKINVPSNYREARQSEQWEFWEAAMNEEKDSLDAHECFEYVERERGKKVIPVHWIYSAKVDEHGNVTRYKARLVAQGCRQILGVDVDEVFAPTSSFGARRVLLAKAAQENLEVHQVDIKTAFLNGELEEEVYVTQPPGFENGGSQVCRLKKALYGLKQAPRAWYQTLDGVLEKHGFSSCMSDAGIYVTKDTTEPMYLVLFVDDMLIMCKNLERVLAFKETIAHEFAIHDLGEVSDFLGCRIVRDRERRVMYMSSVGKIDALVEKFGLSGDTRPVETPMSKSFLPTAQASVSEEGVGSGLPLEPGHRYCELIGSLLYLANTTRPDIAQAVGVLSRYRGTPTTAHMNEALRLLRYLKGTREYALQLGGSKVPLEGFVDADYAGDLDTRASTTGFVFRVYGGSVAWGSKKQSATANSTVEAEFRAASHAVKEAIWLRGLLEELQFDVWKIPLYCDNTGCIQNLKNPVNSKYTKHVAVSFHHARTAVIQGQVDIKYIATQANVADIFTKPLVPVLFKQHCRTLGVMERE